MAVPVWTVGQVLTASDVNSWFVPIAAYKVSDLSRPSNITPGNDPDLTISLAASAVYEIRIALFLNCASSAVDFRFQFTIPASASGEYVHWYWSGATTFVGPAAVADSFTQQRVANIQTSADAGITGHGTLFTAGSTGSLTLQWAQATSSATPATLRKGSHLIANRIG